MNYTYLKPPKKKKKKQLNPVSEPSIYTEIYNIHWCIYMRVSIHVYVRYGYIDEDPEFCSFWPTKEKGRAVRCDCECDIQGEG